MRVRVRVRASQPNPHPHPSPSPNLWLYALQGATFGLVGGALPVLVSGAPLASLGLLSLSLLPFALKVALAPLIDAYWSPRLGRRRSWV